MVKGVIENIEMKQTSKGADYYRLKIDNEYVSCFSGTEAFKIISSQGVLGDLEGKEVEYFVKVAGKFKNLEKITILGDAKKSFGPVKKNSRDSAITKAVALKAAINYASMIAVADPEKISSEVTVINLAKTFEKYLSGVEE